MNGRVDIALIEAGMGGLLDSTNVVTPIVSIIPSIALEHTKFLGIRLKALHTIKQVLLSNNVQLLLVICQMRRCVLWMK